MPRSELDAADRALCEFEDARQAPCITATSWGTSFFPVDVSGLPVAGKLSAPVDVPLRPPAALCVWCALERTLAGQGSAPRINVDVVLQSCARHSERPDGAVVLSKRVNPNAGIVPAYPKGRYS